MRLCRTTKRVLAPSMTQRTLWAQSTRQVSDTKPTDTCIAQPRRGGATSLEQNSGATPTATPMPSTVATVLDAHGVELNLEGAMMFDKSDHQPSCCTATTQLYTSVTPKQWPIER